MTLFICPRCQKRLVASPHSGDFVHECDSGNAVFDEEDVTIISTTVDEFGDNNKSTGKLKGDIMRQGQGDTLFGTRAWIEGNINEDKTLRGNNSDTTRTRQHYEYIEDPSVLDRRGK